MPSTSPFPGLDPWLEEHWGDVHTRFMVYASDQTGQPLICVRRATRRGAELYGAFLREPLPNIGIPLRPTDGDAVLQLQPVFNEIYRKGRYDSIDYRRPPAPRLSAEDERWVAEVLRQVS